MLVITRRAGIPSADGFSIGDDIHVQILEANNGRIRIGITAPENLSILRDDAVKRDPKSSTSPLAEQRG